MNENRIEQTKKFEHKDSSYFEITSSEKNLRDLMYFMQQEGVAAQNSFSDSPIGELHNRTFHLWVDKDDEEKIKRWLADNSFLG